MVCTRSKDECKDCFHNSSGWCTLYGVDVEFVYNKWALAKKSRMKHKLNQNKNFFTDDVINEIISNANTIKNSDLKSKEQIDAMNNLKNIFNHWKVIDTRFLEDLK